MSQAADAVRSQRHLRAAPGSSHDRVIGTLRVALPLAIVLLVIALAFAPLTVGRDISFVLSKDRVQVAKERMRVSEALYRGEDSKGQPFQISAASAVQATSRDPIVRLEKLAAKIALADGPATLVANRGRYDMDSEKIAIDGPVLFRDAGDYRMRTRDVTVDLKTRSVASGGPVDGSMPLGTFAANRLTADLNDRVVVLQGDARLHIVQGRSRGPR
jgi:lipopolysaccharide export system protein LptC